MDTYNPNKLTAASKKVDISLRQLADFDETSGDRNRVDNVRDNQVLVSLSKFNRPKTFSFRYISDILIGGNGITISTDKDGITTISNTGVRKIIAGTNVTISPASGLGDVTINAIGGGGGSGDMTKAVYDTDNDGVVDQAECVKIVVRNSTGVTLTKGQVVYLLGATGNRPNAVLADASTEATSSKTIGLVSADILNNADGYVTISGTMHDLDLSMFAAGDRLWLNNVPGGIVATSPPAEPNHAVFIGTVARAHPTQGRIVLAVQNGYELDELHGVLAPTPANNDVLTYESSTSLWKNKSVVTALGYTPYNATNPSGYTSNTGTVTNVSALSLGTTGTDLSSTVANGTTTPVITLNVPTASATNRGALSSTDWTTFNNKQNALSLTTTGTSGPATLVGSTLNIPQYSGGGGGSSTDAIAYAIALG